MTLLMTLAVVLAQSRTETGKTNQTSWFPLLIALVVFAIVAAALHVRRTRRAHGEPPMGSVPASEVDDSIRSGRMSQPPDEARRQP